jgi:hypothetical protein
MSARSYFGERRVYSHSVVVVFMSEYPLLNSFSGYTGVYNQQVSVPFTYVIDNLTTQLSPLHLAPPITLTSEQPRHVELSSYPALVRFIRLRPSWTLDIKHCLRNIRMDAFPPHLLDQISVMLTFLVMAHGHVSDSTFIVDILQLVEVHEASLACEISVIRRWGEAGQSAVRKDRCIKEVTDLIALVAQAYV